jgi:hypothetical protein
MLVIDKIEVIETAEVMPNGRVDVKATCTVCGAWSRTDVRKGHPEEARWLVELIKREYCVWRGHPRELLPFRLGSVELIEQGEADEKGYVEIAAICTICGAASTSNFKPSLTMIRRVANNVMKYLRPVKGHGSYGYT